MKYYKTLTEDHKGSFSGFDFTPYLPNKGNQPGEWLPDVETLEMCESGYHVTDAAHLLDWLHAEIWEVETRGEKLEGDDKTAWQSIRFVRKLETWNDKTARLFACWCMRQVGHLLTDERSRKVVEVSEQYANGEATQEELAAARSAARSAAWVAAWDAARSAAWDAARSAAWDAARSAQTKHLIDILGE
jgi:hypothetical protein